MERHYWDNEHVIDLLEEYAQIMGLKYTRFTPYRNCPSSSITIYFGERVHKTITTKFIDDKRVSDITTTHIEGGNGDACWCNAWIDGMSDGRAFSTKNKEHVAAMNKIIQTHKIADRIDDGRIVLRYS